MKDEFPFRKFERKWQERWRASRVFECSEDPDREKFYCLEMFPYPSGKLHMGHVRNYSIGDAFARYHRMKGCNVLHPMGWDAFGLPAENAAIERNVHPGDWTSQNIDTMRAQFKSFGFAIDWTREVATCHPEYYRWCQWFFLKMYERDLAYRKKSQVNWCQACRTVLANEQVENGTCWRCHQPVRMRELNGWFLRITHYAEELLNDLEMLRGSWPDRVITMQQNWIGRSEGAYVDFPLDRDTGSIRIFTTRPDTLYGATFIVLAPENPLVMKLAERSGMQAGLQAFIDKVRSVDIIERTSTGIPKEGVFTGCYAINPLTEESIPIWVSDFVLMEYGTGAIMSVPAHDQRDFEFARKYQLPIRIVIVPGGEIPDEDTMEKAYEAEGIMVNSGRFTGMPAAEGKRRIIDYLEMENMGEGAVTYRLRDWGISRQRYWGTPIPVIHCPQCGIVPVPETDLPVRLPVDIEFDWKKGGNPLADWPPFVNVRCPRCNKNARRETDTMDTFIDSSWYFARYTSARNTRSPVDPVKVDYWMPVDHYIGGIEHAVMHLLYARFFQKVMRDIGLTRVGEPFTRLLTQGMVCLEVLKCPRDGYLYPDETIQDENGSPVCAKCGQPVMVGRSEKMSKSKRNTKDPEEYLARYGADTMRLFSLFASPPERDLDWSDTGVEGAFRFLKRVWRFAQDWHEELADSANRDLHLDPEPDSSPGRIRNRVHQTVKRVTANFESRYHFNTSISACMELVNELVAIPGPHTGQEVPEPYCDVIIEAFRKLVPLLSPFAPHFAEELWSMMGNRSLLAASPWPEYDESVAFEDMIIVPIQIQGKVRARLEVPAGTSPEVLEAMARADESVGRWTRGKTIRKIIIVPDRLVNIVIS
ncbi:leucine--tRNA ligase [bacterium]|nr:leucine--tRNA ligase [candidate division CSSED10-310 bacterium]